MTNRFVSEGDDFKIQSLCPQCKHKTLGKATCKAYPNGIPPEILTGQVLHNKPYRGDNGIQFEPLPE